MHRLKILYIVGDGSTHENIELRWSLRSLEKFCTTTVEPVLVGSMLPDWFVGHKLYAPDTWPHKEQNIFAAICDAVEEGLVDGEKFQISADDHFWVKPVDLSRLPIYYRELTIPEWDGKGNNHAKALGGTRQLLLENVCTTYNTAVHCNQWVFAKDIRIAQEMLAKTTSDLVKSYGVVSWALFPNLLMSMHYATERWSVPIMEKHDVKIRETKGRAFLDEIGESEIASVNDAAFECPELVEFFKGLYPTKSRWEK